LKLRVKEGGYSLGISWLILDSLLVTGLTYRFVEG
jgi:hypothetical protein